MRLPLEAKESECLKLIYSDKLSCEESLELVVPDTCADAEKILDIRGQALLVSKAALSDGVLVTACVEADVIFLSEENEPACISSKLNFEFSAIAKGIEESSQLVVSLEICRLEARLLNPRKILIRAELTAEIKAYKEDVFTLWNELPEAGENGVYLLSKEAEHSLVAGIGEKNFTISDEYELPEDCHEARIISCVTELHSEDVKVVGNKLVFKAKTETHALLSGEGGNIVSAVFETPFSQIIETENARDDAAASISLSLLSADFVALPDRDGGVIAANFKLSANAVCTVSKRTSFIADSYSNKYPLVPEYVRVPAVFCQPSQHRRVLLEGELDSGQVEFSYLRCHGITIGSDGGRLGITARLGGIGKDEKGNLIPISLSLRGTEDLQLDSNCEAVLGMAHSTSLNIRDSGNVSLEACFDVTICRNFEFEAICAIEADELSPTVSEGRPSLTVLCADRGESLWDIAKRHGSTIEAIESANSIGDDFDAKRRPLIVPKV